ncbi:unnamed protein product [Vicia faba]|uniref:PB1-like domain-containing protein n=1 Tax=Vicia faba TaxID=3906 RepID=A0AAV1AMD4_VICFA|nr:unnamed protein product [Vicia faba]
MKLYVGEVVTEMDWDCDVDFLSYMQIEDLIKAEGYCNIKCLWYWNLNFSFSRGLRPLNSDKDVLRLVKDEGSNGEENVEETREVNGEGETVEENVEVNGEGATIEVNGEGAIIEETVEVNGEGATMEVNGEGASVRKLWRLMLRKLWRLMVREKLWKKLWTLLKKLEKKKTLRLLKKLVKMKM